MELKSGLTVLIWAAMHNNDAIVGPLVEYGADPNTKDKVFPISVVPCVSY